MKIALLLMAVGGALVWGWLMLTGGEDQPLPVPVAERTLDTVSQFRFPAELPDVPPELAVFGVQAPAMDAERFGALLDLFGLQGEIDVEQDIWTVRHGARMLEASVRPGTGYLRYSDEEKLLSERQAINLLSDDEAIDKATAFLSENGWLPDDATLKGVDYYEFAVFDASGELLDEGVSAVSAIFGLSLAGLPVDGPGAKVSATFGDDGLLIGAAQVWRDVREAGMRPTRPLESAVEGFKGFWPAEAGDQVAGETQILSVVIDEVYLAYYAEPGVMPQQTIEPVYVFAGHSQVVDPQGEAKGGAEPFVYTIPAVE